MKAVRHVKTADGRVLSHEKVQRKVEALIALHGVRGLARRLHCAPSEVLRSRHAPRGPILRELGLEEVTGWVHADR